MTKQHSTLAYAEYAQVYDQLKGDRSESIALIKKLIKKYQPHAKEVLELACGTGSLMEGLQATYHMTGLDVSPAMLQRAKQKMPHVPMYLADMTDFHLGQKFDVIFCVHNSVNHLPSFVDWKEMFACVSQQLKRGGIFIFDINTRAHMDVLTRYGIGVHGAGEHYVLTKVSKHPENDTRYIWEVRIFARKDPYSFTYRPTTIEINTYPEEEIVRALRPDFKPLDIFSLPRTISPEDSNRTYFVYQKV
jgi:SAM-dependent methyltransferase